MSKTKQVPTTVDPSASEKRVLRPLYCARETLSNVRFSELLVTKISECVVDAPDLQPASPHPQQRIQVVYDIHLIGLRQTHPKREANQTFRLALRYR